MTCQFEYPIYSAKYVGLAVMGIMSHLCLSMLREFLPVFGPQNPVAGLRVSPRAPLLVEGAENSTAGNRCGAGVRQYGWYVCRWPRPCRCGGRHRTYMLGGCRSVGSGQFL